MKWVIALLALALLSCAQADTLVLPDRSSSAGPEVLVLAKKLLQSANFTQDDLETPLKEAIDQFATLLAGPHVIVDLAAPWCWRCPKTARKSCVDTSPSPVMVADIKFTPSTPRAAFFKITPTPTKQAP